MDLRNATTAEAEAYRAGLRHALALLDVPSFAPPPAVMHFGLAEVGRAHGAEWFQGIMRDLLDAALDNAGGDNAQG